MAGMDIQAVRRLGEVLDQGAGDLEAARGLVGAHLDTPLGWGPNIDELYWQWHGQIAPSLDEAARLLRDAAGATRSNADDQERTSNDYLGAGAGVSAGAEATGTATVSGDGGPLDWLADRGSELWDSAGVAVEWVTDRGQDAGGAVAGWWDATSDDWRNAFDARVQLWDATAGSLLDGRAPRTTEVVASWLLADGALVGAAVTTLTPWEVNLFDDGEPYAGDPRPVPTGDDTEGTPPLTSPANLEDLTRSVTDAYNAGDGVVRITTVESDQGPRVIVSVPGTQPWSPLAGDNPMDLTGNLVTAGGGSSTMSQAVELAMQNADIPDGAEVMLVGHSQGGMTVADLTSDPQFVAEHNVTTAMTFGSPIDSQRIDPSVSVLELQHSGDVVPKLDLGDSIAPISPPPGFDPGEQHSTVTLDNPARWYDALGNHSHRNYSDSIEQSSDPDLLAFTGQLRQDGFLTGTPSNTSAVDISVGRKG